MHKKLTRHGQTIATDRALELATPILHWFVSKNSLLDFGCGVGHLGYVIAQKTHQQLVSLDVREYPMSHPAVKPVIFDGETIPYPDNSFDATIVAYTLHHTWHPEKVLKEIMRVTRNRIIVSEDLLKTRHHIPFEVLKDIVANCFSAHITMQYKTVGEWEEIFSQLGLITMERIFHSSKTLLHFNHVSWLLMKTTNGAQEF